MVANPLNENPFTPAVKQQSKLRMLMTGPSGSGKTYSSLLIARRIAQLENGKIALIDTEGRSATKYAGEFEFDVLDISGDYNPQHYINGILAAEKFGYAVLVIDSLTHAWKGAGGVLEIVDKAGAKMGGNDWAGWSKGRPAHNNFIDTLINAQVHIIGTARSKTLWEIQENSRGKKEPVKIGVGADQSGDFEYEFDLAAMVNMEHKIRITKTRCSTLDADTELDDTTFLADTLHAWLTDGEPPVLSPAILEQRANSFINTAMRTHRLTKAQVYAALGIESRLSEYDWTQPTGVTMDIVREYAQAQAGQGNEPPAEQPPANSVWRKPNIQPLAIIKGNARKNDIPDDPDSLAFLAGVDSWTIDALEKKYPAKVNDAWTAIKSAYEAVKADEAEGKAAGHPSEPPATDPEPEPAPQETPDTSWHSKMADYVKNAWGITENTAFKWLSDFEDMPIFNWGDQYQTRTQAEAALFYHAVKKGFPVNIVSMKYVKPAKAEPYMVILGLPQTVYIYGDGEHSARQLIRDLDDEALTAFINSLEPDQVVSVDAYNEANGTDIRLAALIEESKTPNNRKAFVAIHPLWSDLGL